MARSTQATAAAKRGKRANAEIVIPNTQNPTTFSNLIDHTTRGKTKDYENSPDPTPRTYERYHTRPDEEVDPKAERSTAFRSTMARPEFRVDYMRRSATSSRHNSQCNTPRLLRRSQQSSYPAPRALHSDPRTKLYSGEMKYNNSAHDVLQFKEEDFARYGLIRSHLTAALRTSAQSMLNGPALSYYYEHLINGPRHFGSMVKRIRMMADTGSRL
ncbi:hypothetical protein CONLIGDRAFT_686810 [Coniochaeta ligniaria NRRL 30616]|uniref:Uncharacterized protein n=1 Tax=Coniochaeta ligniaria NRRL 30616 TaxID=1408157 RepID=A0A1J7I7H6_9PEZI|nr:hypothetical protein CONLIGDRAFT_686810 [Coniochaeta ligniaria NRRL 30616]